MAVPIEFICAIVKRSAIDRVFEGGSDGYMEVFGPFGGRVNSYDPWLIKEGAMNPLDIESVCKYWESLGLEGLVTVQGKKHWRDFCVIDELLGLTFPCHWLEYDRDSRLATFKEGTEITV